MGLHHRCSLKKETVRKNRWFVWGPRCARNVIDGGKVKISLNLSTFSLLLTLSMHPSGVCVYTTADTQSYTNKTVQKVASTVHIDADTNPIMWNTRFGTIPDYRNIFSMYQVMSEQMHRWSKDNGGWHRIRRERGKAQRKWRWTIEHRKRIRK